MKEEPVSHSTAVVGMGACYALGTFTDNFYKQAAILLAASTQMTSVQSVATVLFSLPFIVFSAWAGWLADRMVKKYIVVAAKSMELLALLAGGLMLVRGNWVGILAVIFFMGSQATIFSPALNGSIPENFPPTQVPRVNSLIKLASTAAILAGMALAGVFLDFTPSSLGGVLPSFGLEQSANIVSESGSAAPAVSVSATPDASASAASVAPAVSAASGPAAGTPAPVSVYGRTIASVFIVIIAALGLLTAFTLRKKPAATTGGPGASPFPLTGPVDSVRHVLECRKDPSLFLALLAEAWFYGVAAVAVISVANLAASLGYSNTIASLISAVLMLGIAAGSLLAGGSSAESWRRLLLPSATSMGLLLALTGLAPLVPASGLFAGLNPQLCWIFGCQALCGLFGGVYLIPITSYIQVRPAAHEKGRVLGVSNFMSFVAMSLFGAAFCLISLLPPALTFVVYGIATLGMAWCFLHRRLRGLGATSMQEVASGPLAWFLRGILALRYKVTVRGLESIAAPAQQSDPAGSAPGVLFLPNHPALIDPVIVYSRLSGLGPRPLADERQMRGAVQGLAARLIHAVTIPDMQKDGKGGAAGVMAGLDNIIAALKKGDNVLLYPAGRVYRSARESLGANSAVARILSEAPEVRVVLARSTGLWGSVFSYAEGKTPNFSRQLMRGLLAVLANGVFFTPRRRVDLEFVEPADLPRDGDKMRLNGYLEDFYNVAERPAMAVPRFFWQGSTPVPVSARVAASAHHGHQDLPEDLRQDVYSLIRESASLPEDQPLSPEHLLSTDLQLDSLGLADLASALETRFGHPIPSMENLVSVGDCLLAAMGNLADDGASAAPKPIPAAWFALDNAPEGHRPLPLPPPSQTILDAFLHMTRQNPSRPFLADRSGVRSRRQILIGVLALSHVFRQLPDQRLGIMLPAVPAAVVVWLAALLAGKEPVMLNWTVGARNMAHCITLSGITRAVTSSALLDQLARTGNPVKDAGIEWLAAERLAAGLRLADKFKAAVRAAWHCLGFLPVRPDRTPDIAAVLFTSGSESNPKAVPLSHSNLMTNAGDILTVLQVKQRDRVLAMLPPFHSFGLMVGLVAPATTGLCAAYHPNPTESAPLVSLVRDYKLSLLGATPTFLDAMISRAQGTSDLSTLRFAFAGAEKCPERVYQAFSRCCPTASLCEGYGITECSPVVSVNRPGQAVPGSIGHPLPSVRTAIVIEEDDAQGRPRAVRRAKENETGMLLVRGKSIFSGYLGQAPDPFVEFEGERWYRTGDLLSQDSDGRLVFKGRLKRFVKIGGEMISLPQMEELLQTALKDRPDLPEDGKPFVAVEARPGSEDAGQAEILAFTVLPLTPQEVNHVFRQAGLAPIYAVRRIVRVQEIPLLGTGKTDYRALQALV